MSVVLFKKNDEAKPQPIMVSFDVSGGSIAMAARLPIDEAIIKLEEITDLLRVEKAKSV